MRLSTLDDIRPARGADLRAGAGAAVALVGALWGAALVGLPTLAVAGLASLALAGLSTMLLRQVSARRREGVAAAAALAASALSESRFKLLADHSADMIVESDSALVRRFVSPSSLRLLGYAPEELVGARVVDIVHPDDRPAYADALRSLLDGSDEELVTTQRYRRKDGAYVWTEANIRVTRDPASGRRNGYVGSLRDVTARRAAETALRDSEAFLRGVIDASPDCIKVLDRDGQISFMSRNGVCLLEFDAADAPVGRDFASLWPAEVRPDMRAAVAAAAAGTPSRLRAACLSAKGRPLQLEVVIAPIRGPDGHPERLLALSRDVSAETVAEASLRRAQDRYRLLAENSSDVVMLRLPGPDGRALYVSPSADRVLGYPAETIESGDPSDLVHPDDLPDLRDMLHRLRPVDGTVLHTHRIRRMDGVFVWVEGAFQVAERAGEPTIVVALRDVTERRQRSEDLAAAKEVAEAARRSAEQASEAKSDFLAAMSHEIRTPLNSIIGFTDLMIDAGDLPVQAARHAELIRASGAALLTVVNDILDFSKVEAGAVELEAIPFSPVALAHHCAAILRGYAGTKALDIEVEIGERLPPGLVGDEARLRQVLLNLLNNAVKFTPRGQVTLRLARLGGDGAGETVRFEVADTGIGIPDAKRHRLFERFTQVDSSVARRFGGSGLGLAICKKLVELMGGTIDVASREGTGSTFWFTVTLPRAIHPIPCAQAAPAEGMTRSARILVVEDIDINQRLAVALLEAAGHAVDVVGDGADAVSAVSANPYDLVLMDVQMPGMDGMTATRLIRAGEGAGRDVPIVAMTANVFPEQVEAFRASGMDGHLGKPLNKGQLYATVARWSGMRGTAAAAAPPAFDDAAYRQLGTYLGPARLDDVLARLAASLPQRFRDGDATAEAVRGWKADAHVVLSVAGMAGFAALARTCRALDAATPGTAGYAESLAAARAGRDAALDHIATLRAGLAAEAAE